MIINFMKNIFSIILILSSIILINNNSIAQKVFHPAPSKEFVHELVSLLSVKEKDSLEKNLNKYEKASSNEIVIIIIKTLNGKSIEDYGLQIFNNLGIGKKDKNNGVLLLIVKDDKELRINTGKGIEAILTNEKCKRIIDHILVPKFKEAKFYEGILAAVENIKKILISN